MTIEELAKELIEISKSAPLASYESLAEELLKRFRICRGKKKNDMPRYHFHAMQQQSPGTITHIDGIMSCKEIKNMSDYAIFKREIALKTGEEDIDPDKITVCNLTRLA